jgi:hypothetical protein
VVGCVDNNIYAVSHTGFMVIHATSCNMFFNAKNLRECSQSEARRHVSYGSVSVFQVAIGFRYFSCWLGFWLSDSKYRDISIGFRFFLAAIATVHIS